MVWTQEHQLSSVIFWVRVVFSYQQQSEDYSWTITQDKQNMSGE